MRPQWRVGGSAERSTPVMFKKVAGSGTFWLQSTQSIDCAELAVARTVQAASRRHVKEQLTMVTKRYSKLF
jgi:hypothetical protein